MRRRPSKTADWDYDFFVDFDAANSEQVAQVAKTLESLAKQVHVVGTGGVPDAKASGKRRHSLMTLQKRCK